MLAETATQAVTPSVQWSGLFPLMILGGGALGIVMIRSVVRRLPTALESATVTAVGPITVLAMWFAAGAGGTGFPFSTLREDLGEVLFGVGFIAALILAAVAMRVMRIGLDAAVTVGIGLGALSATLALWHHRVGLDGGFDALGSQFSIDGFMLVCTGAIVVSVVLVSLLLDDYLRREGIDGPEMYVLMLISAAGGVVIAGAGDLIVLFLGLETLSIAVYVMAAMHVRRSESTEAGMKYFVLGAVSSAFLLYGIAMIYGATGSTSLVDIRIFLARTQLFDEGLLAAGFALTLVGLGFKVAAVPFHAWTPDVYEGSPTPVVAYMASAVKVAAIAAVVRVFVDTFADHADDWRPPLMVLTVATLLLGSVLAVVQGNVKRMLAYSSIAHTGFILVGVSVGSEGVAAVVFYLVTYSLVVIGSFGVLTVISGRGDRRTRLEDLDGLAERSPLIAAAFTVLLFAQAGVPLTTGFVAKFGVIAATVESSRYWFAALAMATAVVSAYPYLRVVLSMYLGRSADGAEAESVPPAAAFVIGVAVLLTIGFGVVPGPIDDLAQKALLWTSGA